MAAASGLVGELGKGDNQRLFAKVETGKLVKKWEVAGPHGPGPTQTHVYHVGDAI